MLDLSANAIAQGLVLGTFYGILFGFIASGLTIIWGVMKVVNLAHGHIVVFGAMLTANLYAMYRLNPVYSFLLMAPVGAALGAVLYYSAIHPIIGKVDIITLKEEMATLMATFGFGIILLGSHYVINLYVAHDYSTEPGLGWTLGHPPYTVILGVHVQKVRLVVAGLSLTLVALAHLLLTRTRLGLNIRAVAQDARALSLVGVNPVRTRLLTSVLSATLAAMSGALYVMYAGSVTPESEYVKMIGPMSFVVVVLGGLGSVIGSLVGGLILGIAYQLTWAITGEQAYGYAVAFSLLVIMLVVRPQGLFGRKS
jgi:branched-chain amino acid transport system permease protein